MYQVIIVEDDPMVAAINRQYTELTPPFQVAGSFRDEASALAWLKDHRADLIILDYYMPAMDGGTFIDRLHAAGLSPAVIMVTSANDADTVRRLLSRGVVDFLIKPFEFQRFKEALERFARLSDTLKPSAGGLNQDAIDRLLAQRRVPADPGLAKGLNEETLKRIRSFFREHPQQDYTSEELAEQIGLSRITIRRYTAWLTETGELLSSVDYQTGGRPSIRYRFHRLQ